MIRAMLALAAALCLCACAATGTVETVRTVTVTVPAPVSCIPKDSPEAPAYADAPAALKAAPDFAVRDALVKGEWAKHRARETYLEQLRAICLMAAPAPP
jgi:hypothetical protein